MTAMCQARRRVAGIGVAALVAGLAPALAAHALPVAEGSIQYAGDRNAVPGSYIVVFKTASMPADSDRGRALARKYRARIGCTYGRALNGYAISADEADARRFAADPAVASVVQNRVLRISTTQSSPPSWGLDRIDQRNLPLDRAYTYPNSAGAGVTAYVIDTGVRVSHKDFGGRAANGFDAVDNDSVAQDGNGHGTHVAGTIAGTSYGVAKKARIVAVRVLDNSGSGTTDKVISGIDWVARHRSGPSVANLSLGGDIDTALDTAIRNTIASGVTFAVAAGNNNANASRFSPARVAEALTVGATTSTDARAGYSNYGSVLDLFAPGSSITSDWNTSDTARAVLSGTSMATPHVAGAAALYLADHTKATPAQVAAALKGAAVAGVVKSPGTGSPNLLLNVVRATGATGTTGTTGRPYFVNAVERPIADNRLTESAITVAGVTGHAPLRLGVEVHIRHPRIGDLRIQLVAPDGTVHLLKPYATGGARSDVDTTYAVVAGAGRANGTWRLRIGDNAPLDSGRLTSWALRF
ncbi:S8 family serine peptidase [Streptomyces sp. NPDC048664]|uniref:S8 family peptidase n=1 Tax=Streptomyces sp. NPDC048664 TaxID=3154505 RepID=UPI00341906C8